MVYPSLNLLETVFVLRSPGEPYPGLERLTQQVSSSRVEWAGWSTVSEGEPCSPCSQKGGVLSR